VLQAAGLVVETRLPEEARMVVGDPARVAQAVGNLLDNAQKFTDPGGRIGVELRTEGGGGAVAITVSDTGMGMSAEVQEHLFEPFAQPSFSLRRGGLGLGLALVRGLVELHGGSVSASSPGPGLGSAFTLRLPLSGGEAEPRPPEPERPRAGKRVLIVEDSEDAAESLGLALQMAGHEVALASSGPQGLEAALRLRPDVVLSDIGLGAGMSGYDLARAIRASPDLQAVRLVAVTGYGLEEDRRRAHEAGFDAHLVKPFDIDALCRVIERLLGPAGPAPRAGAEGRPAG
jgi:CheY-like chemotaxis protein